MSSSRSTSLLILSLSYNGSRRKLSRRLSGLLRRSRGRRHRRYRGSRRRRLQPAARESEQCKLFFETKAAADEDSFFDPDPNASHSITMPKQQLPDNRATPRSTSTSSSAAATPPRSAASCSSSRRTSSRGPPRTLPSSPRAQVRVVEFLVFGFGFPTTPT